MLRISTAEQTWERNPREGGAYRVLQGGEADEAQEELPTGGHRHRGVHATQGFYGSGEIRSQALECLPWIDHMRNVTFTFVSITAPWWVCDSFIQLIFTECIICRVLV